MHLNYGICLPFVFNLEQALPLSVPSILFFVSIFRVYIRKMKHAPPQ